MKIISIAVLALAFMAADARGAPPSDVPLPRPRPTDAASRLAAGGAARPRAQSAPAKPLRGAVRVSGIHHHVPGHGAARDVPDGIAIAPDGGQPGGLDVVHHTGKIRQRADHLAISV